MDDFVKKLIMDAYKKCWGLRKLVSEGNVDARNELSRISGVSIKYLNENLKELFSL